MIDRYIIFNKNQRCLTYFKKLRSIYLSCCNLSECTILPIWAGLPIPANYILSGYGIRFLGFIWPLKTPKCSLFIYLFCYRSIWSLYSKALPFIIKLIPIHAFYFFSN